MYLQIAFLALLAAQPEAPSLASPLRAVDLHVGGSEPVMLTDGKTATVKLLDLRETRDSIRDAVRRAEVDVEVNGHKVTLVSANYRLPTTVAGVQIDCPITKGYPSNATKGLGGGNPWG